MKTYLNYLKLTCFTVCAIMSFHLSDAQTYNYITTGDMESGGWTGVPGNTNLVCSFDQGSGINSTGSLKTVTTSLGGDNYYILRCEEIFRMTYNDRVTISFWAKGSVANMRLQAWVQESDGFQWMNFGDADLTTNWKQYRFSVYLSTQTSSNYKVKFRGYDLGTMYIDNVKIGPIDYEDVQQSGIYEVSLSQNGMTWPVNVFRNSCPKFQLGYQGMDEKDEGPLDLFKDRTINWTKFSFENPITVRVKVLNTDKVPVSGKSVRILPSRFGISSSTNGNIVTFTVSEPGQYSVEIGDSGYQNGLIIFADPLETNIPDKSDPDFLVLYEATTNDVSSISQDYTGVYFRRGVHNIGKWNIPSHIKNVYFEDGSWVYGALLMIGNSDVSIYGRGVLSSYKMNYRETYCVEAKDGSNRITIEGLVVADPKYFAIRLVGKYNEISYAKVIGGWVYNCDGISAFKGSNVSKCFIWANDDAIKVYRDSLTWSDIVVWQLNNGGIIQMSWGGPKLDSTARKVVISRLDVLRAEWNKDRFNVGLLNCVGNHYDSIDRYDLMEDWMIEDVVTESEIPLIWNVTPDDCTKCHIHGLHMKNWNVKMQMNTEFQNRIIGNDSSDYFSGFVFENVYFNGDLLTNINYITTGEMDNGGWVAVPNTTNQVVTLANGFGTGEGWGLRSVVTNMGGGSYYVIKGTEKFHLTQNEKITISFWARATAAGKRLVPWIQETDNYTWMNLGDLNLTTNYKRYDFTNTMSLNTSDNYQVKFRGYETAWIFIDKVQIGPPDWRTLTKIQTKYLNTPVFLPASGYKSGRVDISSTTGENQGIIGMYPNPVSDVIYLNNNNEIIKFRIYNLSGTLLITGKGNQVDVTTLNDGFYFIVTDNNYRDKFIKVSKKIP